jgi:O-glycosyl hydrolase
MVKKTENCGNINGWQLLLLLLITSLMTTAVEGATGTVDINTVYQELEGFGASNVWSGMTLVALGDAHPEIYDVIFGDLGLDILRLRNTYGYDSGYISRSAEVISEGRARTGRPLQILISSWSPQGNLKSTGNTYTYNGTLAGGPSDYVYDAFADWWGDALAQYASEGVVADYISMQNEPDFSPSDPEWDSCRFEPSETTSYAGYDTAFEAVYSELYSRMGTSMPKMLPPETAGLNRAGEYINALDNLSHVYGFAHHLYNGGGAYNDPDGFITAMTTFAASYGYKPLLQTEFSRGDTGTLTWTDAMNLALLIYNSLTYEKVSAYLYYELTYGSPKGLVSITTSSWTINPVYYAFKHYSAFTDPGWSRVYTSVSGLGSSFLRMSAFKSPENDKLTIVIINFDVSGNINLTLTLNGFSPASSEVYRSSETENWVSLGTFSNPISLPAKSITTISLTGTSSPDFSNCDKVQAAGYALTSDISGDCYVNYKDLKIVADYWVRNDCGWPNNDCGGADLDSPGGDGDVDFFDYVQLISQWLQCNDPEDSDCAHNW